MSTPNTITCTLCSSPARLVATPNFGHYSAIGCATCGEFVVSGAAAARIGGLPAEFKDRWRSMIRSAQPNEILLIIVEPVGTGGGLKEELVLRSTLRL